MAKGRFQIQGTKDFLILAVFCGFVCLWAIRDAWFPTKKVLKKHPQVVPVAMNVPGVIQSLPLKPGAEIHGETILAVIYDEPYRKALTKATLEFKKASETRDPSIDQKLEALLAARENLRACTLKNTDVTLSTSHGEEVLRGVFLEYLVQPATRVEAGEPVLSVRPKDTFYQFNKTLTVLSFLGFVASFVFHRIASR